MTIFLSAFLLFQVQPLIGKVILPWFGGTPAVWMTCLLLFQVLLLGGYLYAHVLVDRVAERWQGRIHLGLLLLSLLLLPLAPSEAWKPVDGGDPTLRILALLLATVGGPFLVLSATSPLLQAWFVRRFPGRSPYRLYSLSNAGSLLALLSYPFVFEPTLRLGTQMTLWSWGYGAFVLLCSAWALRIARRAPAPVPGVATPIPATRAGATERPGASIVGLWLLLSTLGSAMLLATTNQITQNVAPVPFLWVLALSLYLLSFILCFDDRRWYRRGFFGWALAASLFAVPIPLIAGPTIGLASQVSSYTLVLFACCMACHGELAALKPGPRHLTAFYLLIATGGALGGVLVTLVAPAVFDTLMEFPVALGGCCVGLLLAKRREALAAAFRRRFAGRPAQVAGAGLATLLLAVAAIPGTAHAWKSYLLRRNVVSVSRNFYGVLQVGEEDRGNPSRHRRTLTHGNTLHGIQFQDPLLRGTSASYYGADSGIGIGFRELRQVRGRALRIGVVGMGAGTLAAFAERGDALRFYEINSDVETVARRWFTFWDDAVARGAFLEVALGDARITLEKEVAAGDAPPFDLLVIDAFSSDAVPVHLLTAECFALYRRRLASDGVIAAHVSNQYLSLSPVVREQAERLGFGAVRLNSPADDGKVLFDNDWVVASQDASLMGRLAEQAGTNDAWPTIGSDLANWTDDYSSLFPLLK